LGYGYFLEGNSTVTSGSTGALLRLSLLDDCWLTTSTAAPTQQQVMAGDKSSTQQTSSSVVQAVDKRCFARGWP
jgi:hypothetical protein